MRITEIFRLGREDRDGGYGWDGGYDRDGGYGRDGGYDRSGGHGWGRC